MLWKCLFLIPSILVSGASWSLADEGDLPIMLLGRGIVYRTHVKRSMKQTNRVVRRADRYLERRNLLNENDPRGDVYSKEEVSNAKGKRNEYFVGFECVGRDSLDGQNCFKVQAVKIALETKKVVTRGKILLIGGFDPSNRHPQPTKSELKHFMKELQLDYISYLHQHMSGWQRFVRGAIMTVGTVSFTVAAIACSVATVNALPIMLAVTGGDYFFMRTSMRKNMKFVRHFELIDTHDWNWSQSPKRMSEGVADPFWSFISAYSGPGSDLNSEEWDRVHREFWSLPHGDLESYTARFRQAIKVAMLEKQQRLLMAPYPLSALRE